MLRSLLALVAVLGLVFSSVSFAEGKCKNAEGAEVDGAADEHGNCK